MNSDDKEGSKIKCGLDGLDGKFHVKIHVSSMSNGTNDRGPCGCHVAMRWKRWMKALELWEAINFDPELRFENGYNH